jgi:hypothetical protein
MSVSDIGVLALKGLIGGAVVALFAVVGEVLRPRSVAGVTSTQAHGMVAGAFALFVACLCGLDTLKRFGAAKGSVLAAAIWLGVACSLVRTALR